MQAERACARRNRRYVKTVLPIVIQQSRLGGWRGTSRIYFFAHGRLESGEKGQ